MLRWVAPVLFIEVMRTRPATGLRERGTQMSGAMATNWQAGSSDELIGQESQPTGSA